MTSPCQDEPSCLRCGTCCRNGGPGLHGADLPLLARGILSPKDLLTLRRGEYVTDNVSGDVGPSPDELVRLRAGDDGRVCLFYREPAACSIHADRPTQCRVLFCRAPQALAAMYRHDRLTRAAILGQDSPLGALCACHEAETDLVRLATLCRQAASGDTQAREEVARQVRLDAAYRELLPQKAGIAPDTLAFYLGRPLTAALPACRAVLTQGGLYKRHRSA